MGEILQILTWNNGIAACAFLLIILDFLKKLVKHQKILDFELVAVFIIGAATLFFSYEQNQSENSDRSELYLKINTIINKRNIDSINNASFQKYLRDTFGIIKQGIKPVIYNTKIYNSQIKQLKPEALGDSINYFFRMKNDTLFLAPKEGTWAHGYFAFDTINGVKFENMLFDGMGTANNIDKIVVGHKTLNTHLFKIYDKPVYKGEPIKLKMTGDENRYIIFGDQGIPTKRYFYKEGKISWIPEQ